MESNKVVLSLQSHPDDAEFFCAGTLALLHEKGWDIHIATMTQGDCGSIKLGREEISMIRIGEAANAAKILDGTYHCLNCEDVFVNYDKTTLLKAIELIRKVKPTVVFAPSAEDYMLDHVMTSKVAQAACFAAGVPNVETCGVEAFLSIPYLYYVDPPEAKDIYGNKIQAGTYVDITSVMSVKNKMLCCHASQRDWLMTHHGMDEYVESMKRLGKQRGREINVSFAEGFRQHLGHAFAHDNILKSELKDLVHVTK